MKKKLIIPCIFLSFIFSTSTLTIQYLYPVAAIDQQVYCIYQSSPEIITLHVWDNEHKELIPGLLSRFMPAGFELLPNNAGYSFLDNGILRIKEIAKRSPKSLEFLAPIYDINVPQWIDAERGIFAAKVRDSFGIFQFDTDANLTGLLLNPKKDFLYPQKIESTLFYIERVKRGLGFQFRVMSILYPPDITLSGDDEMVAFIPQLNEQSAIEVIDFHNEPIAFLRMKTESMGYLISYQETIEEDAQDLVCSYYQIFWDKTGWVEQKLFDFVLPTALLFKTSDARLFESILPLLPRHLNDIIYFVDSSGSDNLSLNLFEYDSLTGEVAQLTNLDARDEHYFAPILIGNELYCGGSGYENGLRFVTVVQ